MFNTNETGFNVTFGNGWTVSVQWGRGTYCDNRHSVSMIDGSANAEIAAWDKDGVWHDFGGEQVKGWQTPDEVARFISFISNL